MSRGSILTEMYNDGVALSQNIQPKNPDYMARRRAREEKEVLLVSTLNVEQKKLFDEFKTAWFDQEFYFEDENYRQGFYLGIQIASEAFLLKD